MEKRELDALAEINRKLPAADREFRDDGTCISCCKENPNSEPYTYVTQADVSGKKMIVLICDDCGNALPLLEV